MQKNEVCPIAKISIIVPCYNEEKTVGECLRRLGKVDFGDVEKEIIVVDDGSTDNSEAVVREFAHSHAIQVIRQKNRGKGAAVRTGLRVASGDVLIVQDADLEYYPEELPSLLAELSVSGVDAVFGSRRLGLHNKHSGWLYFMGAQFINGLTNILYGQRITDQFTCYKVIRRKIMQDMDLQSDGFEFDAELVAKLFRRGATVREVPIKYTPRTRLEGKKIRVWDGLKWWYQIMKYRFVRN